MLEIAVDTLSDAQNAARIADRIEFCRDLASEGQTPEPEALASLVGSSAVPVVSLARCGSALVAEGSALAELERDIQEARDAGCEGVCFGVLDRLGRIDSRAGERLVRACRPARAIFHRGFDAAPDPAAALESLIALGFDRVLCAGAPLGASAPWPARRARIAAAADAARGRIVVIACGGVRSHNAADLAGLGVEIHSSCRTRTDGGAARFDPAEAFRLRAMINSWGSPDRTT